MLAPRNRLSFFILLTLGLGLSLAAQNKPVGRQDYRVAIAPLRGFNLTKADDPLLIKIPQGLVAAIRDIKSHAQDGEERRIIEEAQRMATLNQVASANAEKLFQRDLSWLTNDPRQIPTTKQSKMEFQKAELGGFQVKDDRGVVLVGGEANQGGEFAVVGVLDARGEEEDHALALKYDLDLLIHGELTQVSDFYILRLYAYNRFLSKLVYDRSLPIRANEDSFILDAYRGDLRELVRGTKASGIVVRCQPSDCDVDIDGAYTQRQADGRYELSPGLHSLSLSRQGYYSLTSYEFLVEADSFSELNLSLEPALAKPLLVETTPNDAAVYLDAVYQGQSSIVLGEFDENANIYVKKDGKSMIAIAQPGSKDQAPSLSFNLDRYVPYDGELYKKRRFAFYRSFGLFMSTLPITALSIGEVNQLYYTIVANTENAGLMNEYYRWFGVAIGSSVASATILGFSIFDYVRYLKASRR